MSPSARQTGCRLYLAIVPQALRNLPTVPARQAGSDAVRRFYQSDQTRAVIERRSTISEAVASLSGIRSSWSKIRGPLARGQLPYHFHLEVEGTGGLRTEDEFSRGGRNRQRPSDP
jgi:hypothetical protein